jgi:hypothetical protein
MVVLGIAIFTIVCLIYFKVVDINEELKHLEKNKKL